MRCVEFGVFRTREELHCVQLSVGLLVSLLNLVLQDFLRYEIPHRVVSFVYELRTVGSLVISLLQVLLGELHLPSLLLDRVLQFHMRLSFLDLLLEFFGRLLNELGHLARENDVALVSMRPVVVDRVILRVLLDLEGVDQI